jgi:rhodanese-related sulfurtransferase
MQPLERTPRRDDAFMTPKPVPDEPGRFVVDATWGTINPIEIADGVETVGELEVREHLEAGLPVIDTRPARVFAKATIPGAASIPHGEMEERLDEVATDAPVVLFCNGPQCSATPDAIRILLAAGHPPDRIRYYRGGIHDWVTLGLPVAPG